MKVDHYITVITEKDGKVIKEVRVGPRADELVEILPLEVRPIQKDMRKEIIRKLTTPNKKGGTECITQE